MNIREINKPVTAKSLNESLAKRFGMKINIDKFTIEQLEDARNKMRTNVFNVETKESFDVVKSDTYQKSKLFLDVLNAAIAERENVTEAGKPDFLDLGKVPPQFKKKVKEGKEDEAELVMASKDMVDRVTGWMEDTAEMQTESMLELADAIRDELGQEQSDAFVGLVKPALEALYGTMETTRTALTQGVAMLTGEGAPAQPMGAEPAGEELPDMGDVETDAEMEPTVDQEDEFAAAGAAAGGEEEAGRAKRESIERSRRLGSILSSRTVTSR
jgi:hypothetical protein